MRSSQRAVLLAWPTSRVIIFLIALALLARLFCIVIVTRDDVLGADPAEYLALAQSIRLHGVFSFGSPHQWGFAPPLSGSGPFISTAARAPLYPLFIAGLWWSNGPPFLGIEIAQALLGAIVCAMTYSIALKLIDCRTALIAGILTALAPLSCYMTTEVMSETLFTFLLMAALWFWNKQKGLMTGVAFGAAALTRPIVLPFIILIALVAAIFKFNRQVHIKVAVAALLMIAPWTVRNILTQHAVIPIQTQGWGANLLFGTVNVPYGVHSNQWDHFLADPAFQSIISSSKTETDAEKEMFHTALTRVLANPVHWLGIRLKEYPRLFADSGMYFLYFVHIEPWTIKIVMITASFIFLGLAIFGAATMWKRWRQFYFLFAFPAYMCLVQFPAYGEPRFVLPVFPILAIFAAIPLSGRLLRSEVRQSLAPVGAFDGAEGQLP